MKVITVRERQYTVYESDTEIDGTGNTRCTLTEPREGSYVRSDDGYWLPVLSTRTAIARNRPVTFIFLPRKQVRSDMKGFVYNPADYMKERYRLSSPARMTASLITNGVDMYTAVMTSYPKTRTPWKKILHKLLSSTHFMRYLLVELDYVNILKQKMIARGYDEDKLIDLMDQALYPEKGVTVPVQIQLWARNLMKDVLTAEEKKQGNGQPQLPGAVGHGEEVPNDSPEQLKEAMRQKMLSSGDSE